MTCSRRQFLSRSVLGAGVLACGAGLVGCDTPASPRGLIPAGPLAELPEGTLRRVPPQAVAIGRDADGVYAMTLICTHVGCDMGVDGSVSFDGVVCDCHGSRFDANGAVTRGPANDPLEHFAVLVDEAGELTIDADAVVAAATRLACISHQIRSEPEG